MSGLAQDIRFSFRTFAKNPGFTAAVVMSLALGIGANSALFSVANALLFRPLPYADPDRLVILWNRSPGLNIMEDWFSTAQYFDIKTSHQGFEQLAIAIGANYNLTGGGEPERVGTIRVSSNLLPMLGARAALGRLFVAEEDRPGRPATAVLSYGMWARRYGRDRSVIGRSLTLNGQPYEIAGVLPERFSLPREVLPTLGVAENGEIFLPLPLPPAAANIRDHEDYNIMGKLARGVSVERAQAEMDAITSRLRREFPEVYPPNGGLTFGIVPLREQVVGDVRRSIMVLLAAVGFVLLIACANVANLLLSRTVARRREIGIRTALGASFFYIARQLLVESLMLACAGGALGVVLAVWSVHWIHALRPKNIPRLDEIAVNGAVLLFTSLVCIVCGLLFGLGPLSRLRRLDGAADLNRGGGGSAQRNAVWGNGNHTRRMLVAAQLALSMVLLAGAGLLTRSFDQARNVAPGFNPDRVLTFELMMSGRKYSDPKTVLNTYRRLWAELDRLPGVRGSGGVTSLPLSQYFAWGPITVEGRAPPPGENFINADIRVAAGRYFETMEIPLIRGRLFNDHDTTEAPRVVIIDEYMAAQLWPGEDPIGKRIRYGGLKSTEPWQTVVGIVGQVKQYSLDADSRIAFYMPHTQVPSRSLYVAVRGGSGAAAITSAVSGAVRAVDPDLPVYRMQTMEHRVKESLARRRFAMLLLMLFAGGALILSAVGVYAVVSYLVAQSTREIGIRIALGATQRRILSLVVGQAMFVSLGGVVAGLAAAAWLSRFIESLLFGVRSRDPLIFLAAPLLLGCVALLASYIPARRAARVDPAVSLRSE